MAAGLPVNIAGFANEIANIVGINNWQLQEASYNGAQFHWMQPSFNGLNPVSGLIDYVQSDLGGASQKPNYGTWSTIMTMKDSVSRKLAVFPVPNYNGFYIEDFGSTGVSIDMVGVVFGPDYLEVLEKCLRAFMDTETSPGSGVGKITGSNFRSFVHPVFGVPVTANNVYFVGYDLITSADKWRAASFRLRLIAQTPDYLVSQPTPPTWQSQALNILNQAQAIVISISQAFAIIQSVSGNQTPTLESKLRSALSGRLRSSVVVGEGVSVPVITGRGEYIESIEVQINEQLTEVSNVFSSSMAFFVQNSAGLLQNSYWSAVVIDFSLLPVYLTQSIAFSYSDAQAVISSYAQKVSEFIIFAQENGYDYVIQRNIQDMKTSVVYLNNIAELFLSQNSEDIVVSTPAQNDLYSLMASHEVDFDKFAEINDGNRGVWFSCLKIPAGTTVNLS